MLTVFLFKKHPGLNPLLRLRASTANNPSVRIRLFLVLKAVQIQCLLQSQVGRLGERLERWVLELDLLVLLALLLLLAVVDVDGRGKADRIIFFISLGGFLIIHFITSQHSFITS